MPKHGFRFPPEVIDAVREHVRNAIRHVAPERFSQEANYTAALASQLEGTAYQGEHGTVVFKSTVFDDRGPSLAERQFGADFAITALISDGSNAVSKAILTQAKLGRIDRLTPGARTELHAQIRRMKRLVDAPKVMEISEYADQRFPSMISGNRILAGEPYTSIALPDYFVTRVTTTLDGATDPTTVEVIQESNLSRAHLIAKLKRDAIDIARI
jgi:hypothetical protein